MIHNHMYNKIMSVLNKIKELAPAETICVFDVDDTLFQIPNKIIVINKKTKERHELSTKKFAEERKIFDPKKFTFDYTEFSNPQKIKAAFKYAVPLISNLKIMDEFINHGFSLGILTARGSRNTIYAMLKDNLMYRDAGGNLEKIGDHLKVNYVFAISGIDTRIWLQNQMNREQIDPNNSEEVKGFVLRHCYPVHYKFKNIIFIDDDKKNIAKAKEIAKQMPKGTKLFPIMAR